MARGTIESTRGQPIAWYRTPLDPALLRELNRRSDARGLLQAGGYLGVILLTATLAILAERQRAYAWLAVALFAHGTVCAFMSNAAHELVHGTVFQRAWLNTAFLNLFAFLRWFPYDYYWASHTEHHRSTLHPPQDLEVVLPTRFTLRQFLATGLIDPARALELLRVNLRLARGRLEGEWELRVLAPPAKRRAAFRWARVLLAGHLAIALLALPAGLWIVPLVLTLTPCYGGWLFFLCNNTQHAGLRDRVADFRLCCRTMYLHPLLEFLYWRMNYHIEHHMYAAVPCYNLPRLHAAIRHELPATPRGLASVWRQLIDIQRRQQRDASYQFSPELPVASTCAQGAGRQAEDPVRSEQWGNA